MPAGTPALRVRDAEPSDAAAIAAVARRAWPAAYAGLFEAGFIELVLTRTYEPGALAATIASCAGDPDAHFLVAEQAGEVVAYLHYGPGAEGPELHRLYVEPDRIGAGIGSALLAELHGRLAPGTEYVALVREGNEQALRFYDRHGFERAAEVDGFELFLERHELEPGVGRGRGRDVLVRYRVP